MCCGWIDPDRNRVGYGCVRAPRRLVSVLSVETDRIGATTYCPGGSKHKSEDPCRADTNGILDWVTNTGPDLDTTVVTRARPLTVARGWKETAAWQGYLSVLSIFVLALSNMQRLAKRDRNRRLSSQRRHARLCLIGGYIVERVRAREKREQPPSEAPPHSA